MASQAREERRERGEKPVNQVSTEPPDLPAKLASPDETEGMATDAANSSQSTVEAVKFQRAPKTLTFSGTDSATKATLHPMSTALVSLALVSYARQRTHIQGGRQHLRLLSDLVAMATMSFKEPLVPQWTKQLPGRWYLDAASARWRGVC